MVRDKSRTLLALLAVGVAGVATWAADEQSFYTTIKGSENPSGIPFVEAVRMYMGSVIGSYERNPDVGIRRFQQDVDRNIDSATAEEFIKHVRTAMQAYVSSGRQDIQRICARRHDLVTLPQIEKAFVESEGALNANFERQIENARSILGDARLARFKRYINTQAKKNMSFEKVDHIRLIESRGETPADVLVRVCDRPLAPPEVTPVVADPGIVR